MTDLEWAAKAVGYVDDRVVGDEDTQPGLRLGTDGELYVVHNGGGWHAWDPEESAEDSFNLFIDLNMHVDVERATGTVYASAGLCSGVCSAVETVTQHDVADYRAAARRAIFLAAVQAGKAMP